jgi:hypothetical protein
VFYYITQQPHIIIIIIVIIKILWECGAIVGGFNPLKPYGNYMSHLLQQSITLAWVSYDSHCNQQLFPQTTLTS